MDTLLYLVARTLVALLQALPLRLVARLGRMGGTLVYWLDARHRRVPRTISPAASPKNPRPK